jgi:hypothetical protein
LYHNFVEKVGELCDDFCVKKKNRLRHGCVIFEIYGFSGHGERGSIKADTGGVAFLLHGRAHWGRANSSTPVLLRLVPPEHCNATKRMLQLSLHASRQFKNI